MPLAPKSFLYEHKQPKPHTQRRIGSVHSLGTIDGVISMCGPQPARHSISISEFK